MQPARAAELGAQGWQRGRNLAVSYSVQGDSGHMTYHSGANMTSFITGANTGDHSRDVDGFAYEYTTTSWFFLTTLDGWNAARREEMLHEKLTRRFHVDQVGCLA